MNPCNKVMDFGARRCGQSLRDMINATKICQEQKTGLVKLLESQNCELDKKKYCDQCIKNFSNFQKLEK